MHVGDDIDYWLRSARAKPPESVRRDHDRHTRFAAALEQFDQYMTAAAAVGPATRPLQLYYALTQAAEAIAAMQLTDPLPKAHGLTVTVKDDVRETVVRPAGNGVFQTIAVATGSELLDEAVELGALWASLPELSRSIDAERWPVALRAGPVDLEGALLTRNLELVVDVVPWITTHEQAVARLALYPTLAGGQVGTLVGLGTLFSAPGRFGDGRIYGVQITWPDDALKSGLATELERIAPEYGSPEERWVRPAIGKRHAPSPLMALWAVLFALSMMSRYHPARWANALDIDDSAVAADLEYFLERALDAVSRLVLEAIVGEPVLRVRGR